MDKMQIELAKVIERYFGADAGYLDIDCFTLARRIMEAGWTKPVRCKDCWNYEETMGKDSGKHCGYGRCLDDNGLPGIVFDETFCSYGERREGE